MGLFPSSSMGLLSGRSGGGGALAYEVARKTLFGWGIGSGQVPCLGFLDILERVGVQSGRITYKVFIRYCYSDVSHSASFSQGSAIFPLGPR